MCNHIHTRSLDEYGREQARMGGEGAVVALREWKVPDVHRHLAVVKAKPAFRLNGIAQPEAFRLLEGATGPSRAQPPTTGRPAPQQIGVPNARISFHE